MYYKVPSLDYKSSFTNDSANYSATDSEPSNLVPFSPAQSHSTSPEIAQKYLPGKSHPLSYVPPDSYLERFRQARTDPTNTIPFQTVQKFPKSGNEGLLGWTYRNKDGAIRIREDLTWSRKLETEIHESIHTSDEYETRVLTWWILGSIMTERKRYHQGPREYFR